jgi:membrane protein YqaA with SNARE-associated domain
MSWRVLVEFVVSVAYGVLSSLIPIFNSEIYIVASQVGGFAEEASTAIGCAIGQGIGKAGLVLALRRGGNSKLVRRIRDRPRKPAGKFRTRVRGWSDRMLALLGNSRWGVGIVFLSASVYIPPLYPVTFAVAETRMSVVAFAVAVTIGRVLLFLAIAFGVSALVH